MALPVDDIDYKPNKTSIYFKNILKYIYLVGWPNLWTSEPEVPKIIKKCHRFMSIILNILTWILIFAELGSLFTQNDLTEKQKNDSILFAVSHPVFCSYGTILTYHQETIKSIMKTLIIELKEVYNDEKVERDGLRKSRRYAGAFVGLASLAVVSYGFDGLIQYTRKDGAFVTTITAWPDVHDRSTLAGVVRVVIYGILWIVLSRFFAVFVALIATIVCLSHQFRQLTAYFNSLSEIFEDHEMDSREKEVTYEEAFKVGIRMHSRTLWCTQQCQKSCSAVFSGQIIANINAIVLLMAQMLNSERTLPNVVATLSTMIAVLISTGLVMWSAGDVAVEAAELPTAMFHSGWHHCRADSSLRVRKLLAISMAQAQKPVTIRGLGIVTLSYQSYVSIVKTSYSVFSVLF